MELDIDRLLQELIDLTSKQETKSTFQAPIKSTYYNSGDYGVQHANRKGMHKGVDLRAPGGTPVYSITSGKVINVGNSGMGGLNIKIQHDNNLSSYYAHLNSININKGDFVDNNTIIGTVGNSGNAKKTAPHVHIEVYENNANVNPRKLL